MDIPGTLASLTAALGLLKELRSIDTQVDQAGLKLKIAEITEALADAKLGLIDAQEQITSMESEIARLLELNRRKDESTVVVSGFRYHAVNGNPVGHAYCPVCEESGTLMHLVAAMVSGRPEVCPKCKSNFGHVARYGES